MEKVIIVKTDDPAKSKFNLKVTGMVEKIMEMSPSSVYMEGKPGAVLSSTVSIIPSPRYMFSLTNIKKRNNSKIQADLVKPDRENAFWQIKIKAESKVEASEYEVLEIGTDSQYKPLITLMVSAVFADLEKMEP